MDRNLAERRARALIAKHLPPRPHKRTWTFKWSWSMVDFGACRGWNRTIALSNPITDVSDWPSVKDTILHEIAHAKTPSEPGHGPRWRAWCRKLGCRPSADASAKERAAREPLKAA
jgi:SprT-like family protein